MQESVTPFYTLFVHDSNVSSLTPPKFSYSQNHLTLHLQRAAQTREHCRDSLLTSQAKYTAYTNIGRKDKDIFVGQRISTCL